MPNLALTGARETDNSEGALQAYGVACKSTTLSSLKYFAKS